MSSCRATNAKGENMRAKLLLDRALEVAKLEDTIAYLTVQTDPYEVAEATCEAVGLEPLMEAAVNEFGEAALLRALIALVPDGEGDEQSGRRTAIKSLLGSVAQLFDLDDAASKQTK